MSETFYRLNTILFKDVHVKSQEKPRYSKENSTALKRTRDTVILRGRKWARRGKRGARTRNVNLKKIIKKRKKRKKIKYPMFAGGCLFSAIATAKRPT